MSKEKINTFGEAIKQIKILFSILGIEYWHVYMSDDKYFRHSISHSEKSNVKVYPGMNCKVHTTLIVSDPIELFIIKEDFLFTMDQCPGYKAKSLKNAIGEIGNRLRTDPDYLPIKSKYERGKNND